MDKFRELFALKLAELGWQPEAHREIMAAFDLAKIEYWEGQRVEIHKYTARKVPRS